MQKIMENKGITLVALVVTIIILLILAGVTLNMSLSNNGLIKRAKWTAEETKNAIEDEKKEISSFLEMLGKDAGDITKDDYGAYVTYNLDLNNNNDLTDDWRIFYSNGTNIFLISNDYCASAEMIATACKNSGMTIAKADGYATYTACWQTLPEYNCYDGHKKILEGEKQQCSFPDIFMVNQFYCSDHISDENSRYASTLQCTDYWSNFKTNYADYAIGGPTIEMWVASWNNKHGNDTEEKDKKGVTLYANGNNNEGKGYFIGDTPNSNSTNFSVVDTEGYNDSLYFPHHQGNGIDIINHKDEGGTFRINEYWLSSPTGENSQSGNVYIVNYTGKIREAPHTWTCGFRPLICLNSNVKIVKNSAESSENKTVFDLR